MRLFEQQRILGKEAFIFNTYEIQVAADEEITRARNWDPDSVQSSSARLCATAYPSHRPCCGPQSHTEVEVVYPQRILYCTVLDMKEFR